MYYAKPLGPKGRALLIVAFSVGLLLLVWGGYVEKTHHPAPRWAEYLPTAYMSAALAFLILLSPMPGMTRNMAKAFVAFLTATAALELYFFFS